MKVEAAESWRRQDFGGQQKAVRNDETDVRRVASERLPRLVRPQGRWRMDRDAQRFRGFMHCGFPDLQTAASARLRGARVNSDQVVAAVEDLAQGRNRKFRRPHEYNPHDARIASFGKAVKAAGGWEPLEP